LAGTTGVVEAAAEKLEKEASDTAAAGSISAEEVTKTTESPTGTPPSEEEEEEGSSHEIALTQLVLPGPIEYITQLTDTAIAINKNNWLRSFFLSALRKTIWCCYCHSRMPRKSCDTYDSSHLTQMYLREKWSSNLGFGLVDDQRFTARSHANSRIARATSLIFATFELRRKTYLHEKLAEAGDAQGACLYFSISRYTTQYHIYIYFISLYYITEFFTNLMLFI
tara:strand:- start:525 stop:1196 length:672 start_codon:yes stop_codon:yes gene_type:complete